MDKVIWTTLLSTPYILELGLTCWSLFLYYFELFKFTFRWISNNKHLLSETVSQKKHGQVSFDKKKVIIMKFWFHSLQLHLPLPQLLTQGDKYILYHQIWGRVFQKSYVHHFVFLTRKFVILEWNSGNWKLNNIIIFVNLQASETDFNKVLIVSSLPSK